VIALVKRILFADWLVGYLMIIGLLTTPFFQTDSWRSTALGKLPAQPTAAIGVLCLALALAWRSLLRRDFVWLGPARLTWDDFDGSRVRTMNLRMLGGWIVRFLAVAYVSAVAAQVHGWSMDLVPVGCALLGATAFVALGMARRKPKYRSDIWFEQVVPLLLAALALIPLPVWWQVAAVGAVVAAIAFAPGPRVAHRGRSGGSARRLASQDAAPGLGQLPGCARAAATRASRTAAQIPERTVRGGAVRPRRRAGPNPLPDVDRTARARRRDASRALPAAGAVWWIGSAPSSPPSRTPGRWANSAVCRGCVGGWAVRTSNCGSPPRTDAGDHRGVVGSDRVCVRMDADGPAGLGAGGRCRGAHGDPPMLDFNKLGEVAVPGQADMPIGLVGQLLRGVDVLLAGAAVLTFFPSAVIGVPVVAGLFAFSVWREVST